MNLITHKVIHHICINNKDLILLETKDELALSIKSFVIEMINSFQLPIEIDSFLNNQKVTSCVISNSFNDSIFIQVMNGLYTLIHMMLDDNVGHPVSYMILRDITVNLTPGRAIDILLEEVP